MPAMSTVGALPEARLHLVGGGDDAARDVRAPAGAVAQAVLTGDAMALVAVLAGADATTIRPLARALRAHLRTFRPLFDHATVDRLRRELVPLCAALRDEEAARRLVADLRTRRGGPGRWQDELDSATARAIEAVEAAQTGTALLDVAGGAAFPWRDDAAQPAAYLFPAYVRRPWRRLAGAHPAAAVPAPDLRRWVSRTTFAASAAAVLGDPAERLATASAALEGILVRVDELDAAWAAVVGAEDIDAVWERRWRHQQRALLAAWPEALAMAVDAGRELQPVTAARVVAGGVLWRHRPGAGPEVLVIHRRRRGDWCFPKGKALVGESAAACAAREVEEETGIRPVLDHELDHRTSTNRNGRPKTIVMWAMRAAAGTPAVSPEVDGLAWMPLDGADRVLDRKRDRRLLSRLATHLQIRAA